MAQTGGSLAETVPQLATKLTSTNVLDISTAIDSLEAIRLRIQSDRTASVQLSWTLQELSAFGRGAVLKTLLDRVLMSSGGLQMEMISSRALVKLAQCKGVVEFCLKEEHYTKVLASYLTAQLQASESDVGAKAPAMARLIWMNGLEGLANFARSSESFRRQLQLPEQQAVGLMPSLERLLSENHLRALNATAVQQCREYAARFVVSMALSHDSRQWVLENGYFRIVAAILRSQNPGFIPPGVRDGAVVICNMVFFRLMELRECLEMMKRDDVISLLRPHRAKMNAANDELFENLEAVVLRGEPPPPEARATQLEWEVLAAGATGRELVPVVCSWEACKEGPETPRGRRFGRCASCQLAYYCSKDHQRLHWRTHKKQCKTGSVDSGSK